MARLCSRQRAIVFWTEAIFEELVPLVYGDSSNCWLAICAGKARKTAKSTSTDRAFFVRALNHGASGDIQA